MLGLAQLNLTESAFVPENLASIVMITIFLAEGDGWFLDPSERPEGDGWAVRTYSSVDALVSADGPAFAAITPRQLDWDVVDDYPAWDDLLTAVAYDDVQAILGGRDVEDALGFPAEGPKLGGWPSLIQGELSWEQHPAAPRYCIQIDADQATSLAPLGSGVLYLGLGTGAGAPVWVASMQYA